MLDAVRGDADLAFAVPVGEHRWVGTARIAADGAFGLKVRADLDGVAGALGLLRPDAAPPGPPVLDAAGAVLHLRWKTAGGIDLAALVPPGSAAAEMFQLRNQKLADALRDGTWEAAMWALPAGRPIPRMALAIGIRSQQLAKLAMEAYLGDIGKRWGLQVTPFEAAEGAGACMPDLRVLPGLSPCYLVTDRALVVGWDRASVDKTLRGAPAGASQLASGATVDFEKVPELDVQVAQALRSPLVARTAYPWGRVQLSASPTADGLTGFVLASSRGCAR